MPQKHSEDKVPTVLLKHALTIATSDSGAGAGIQADLKTFAALKVYGLSVISAVSAQNTMAVTGLECLSPELVNAQLDAIFDDIPVEAIKIGLLGNRANTRVVFNFLENLHLPVVLDPVMVSTSGHVFIPKDAVSALIELMPRATVITPNQPEAETLANMSLINKADFEKAAEQLLSMGPKYVLIKGGHGTGPTASDLLFGPDGPLWFKGPRVSTPNSHGTGCSFSAAIAAYLAQGEILHQAVAKAKQYVYNGLVHSITLGHGPGPLNHFHNYYHYE